MKHIKQFEGFDPEFQLFLKEEKSFILDIAANSDINYTDDELKELYYSIKTDIIKSCKNKNNIFRRINVNQSFLRKIKTDDNLHVGIFWTRDKSLINQWNSNELYDDRFSEFRGHIPLIFTATLNYNLVNLNKTIRNQITASEDEITLLQNMPIIINEISYNKTKLNISDKTFIT